MPMRSEMIHQIYIADGFDDDCDILIHRCLQAEKLNFETFCEIWKDMQFDSLYTGRTSVVEIAELSEELVYVAKQYMMSRANNLEENIAGLFLVYGLLNLQPYPGFAELRLIPEDVPQIKKIEMHARSEKRHDVLYILGTVLVKHSQYHAEQRERGIEQQYRKYLEGFISLDRNGYRPRGVFYRQTEELDLIRELSAVTDRYEAAKSAVTGGKKDPSLSFINQSLPRELDSSLKKIISGIPGLVDDDEIDEADVHYSRVQAIKEKAMKNVVGSIKHLTSAAERTYEKTEQIISEIKSKPGKIKTSSPTKTFLSPKKKSAGDIRKSDTKTNSASPKKTSPRKLTKRKASPRNASKASTSKLPGKRKITPKRRKIKKSKAEISSSDSDSDINLSDLETDSDIDNISGDEINIKSFEKQQNVGTDGLVEIEIDALPTHMTTEDNGQVYEIEIIDKLQKSKADDPQEIDEADEKFGRKVLKNKQMSKKRDIRKLKRIGVLPSSEFSETTRVTRSSGKTE